MDLFAKSRFMPGRFVFVHDAFRYHPVEQGQRSIERGARSRCVLCDEGGIDALHVSAHHRALTCVLGASFLILSSAFSCLSAISQGILLLVPN